MDTEIIFENNTLVVINKPHGLLSIPDREGKDISLKKILLNRYGSIFTVHRLDKETSGAIVFAKDEETHRYLSQSFEGRTVSKWYMGIVNGRLPAEKGTIDEPIMEAPGKKGLMIINKKGKPSVTDYELMEELGRYSLVKFRIHTGRTHQIRVHMQYLGNPLLVDPLYGDGKPVFLSSLKKNFNLSKKEEAERPILNRLALHSWRISFKGPKGDDIDVEATPPKDLRALLQQLRKIKSKL